ncbi:TetR family transcriptional regulator C-terminal domain-containing protein [Tropicimonas marinistellae]|uniref:TetR family transcriptional regulator C-terminal domain-containing protein n=1 Tax=Tropicimonas marinistellae TaxID=1739787 RepID=UPI000AAF649F|nr:TetR family transcriptional regulator C-terminal domain-containing protein [Tropicimonas marinistellae]
MNQSKTPPHIPTQARTRIQRRNHSAILNAALDVFSAKGFRGATVDEIAQAAGLSKPNLLYYFPSKEAIHLQLLSGLLDVWLAPLRDLDPEGDPIPEILTYVRRKLQMSREMPRESRIFANEILQGGTHLGDTLTTALKPLVDEKAAVVARWRDTGRIADVHPYHLIFSIWSLTQHYADFDVQVRTVLGDEGADPYPEAERYLETLFTRMLTP